MLTLIFLVGLDEIDGLIRKLGDDFPEVREEATSALLKYGSMAQPRVKDALEANPEPEVAARLRFLLSRYTVLKEANAVRLVITCERADVEPLQTGKSEGILPIPGGYAAVLEGSPLVLYDPTQPRELWEDLLRREMDKPIEVDMPIALELLSRIAGFAHLIPHLEKRSQKTADPRLKAILQRAIQRQFKEVPPWSSSRHSDG